MRMKSFLIIVLLTIYATSYALDRPFPADAKSGTLNFTAKRRIVIDKKIRKLTAGAQTRDQSNKIVQPATLVGRDLPILYVENTQGQVNRIWVLTEAEAEKHPLEKPPAPPQVLPDRTAKPGI